jgi:hypothetical protein
VLKWLLLFTLSRLADLAHARHSQARQQQLVPLSTAPMLERRNTIVAVLGGIATLALVGATAPLVRDSMQGREAIAVLRAARTWSIRDAQVLAADLFTAQGDGPESSDRALQLVVFVSDWSQTDSVVRSFDALKIERQLQGPTISLLWLELEKGAVWSRSRRMCLFVASATWNSSRSELEF